MMGLKRRKVRMTNKSAAAMLETRSELTIESALAELREMFPDVQLIVSVRDCGEETVTRFGTAREYSIQVGMNGDEFTDADSLAEAVQRVRQSKGGES